MKNFINLLNYSPRYLRLAAMGAMALTTQFSFAQKTFLTGQKTGDRYNVGGLGLLPGGANISSPFDDHDYFGFQFYYGSGILNSDAVTTPVTLTATNELSALVKVAGADVYAQFRNTNNENIAANKITYFKIKEKPVSTGIGVDVGGLLGFTDFNNIVGVGYKGASNYSLTLGGNKNEGQVAGTSTSKLLIDKLGEYYVAVQPTEAYNSVRLSVSIPNSLVQATSTLGVNIYNAFTQADGDACSSKPRYADAGTASGINLETGALRLLALNDLVNNPKGSIDDSPATYSSLSSGVASLGVAGSVSQNFYFDRLATTSEGVKINLGVSGAAIALGLVSGNIEFQAYKGDVAVGSAQSLTNSLSLLNLDLLDIVTVGTGAEAYKNVTVPFYPTGDFDHIEVSLTGVLNLGVLGDAVRIYDVNMAPVAPMVSKTIEYIFTGTQPLTEASTGSTGNSITWIGPAPATTVVGTAASASAYRFPTTLIANGDYSAVATKGSCTVQSVESKLKVIVLTEVSNLPNGISQSPYPTGGSITATSNGHTFTYASNNVPSFIDFNTTTGAITPKAATNTPTVTVPTTYPITVEIIENGVSTGLTLTKQITVNPLLVLPGGPFPATNKSITTYSSDISDLVSARAYGGKGSAFYTYSLSPITLSGRVMIDGVPTGFALSPEGVFSGDPSNKEGSYVFLVYVSDGEQVTSGNFTLDISGGPLPVKLSSFDVKKEGEISSLTWATTAETNSESFDVERSNNGKEWNKIASRAAKGESTEISRYSVIDAAPLNGENLYRLKMLDRDGTFAYSRVESISFAVESLKLYPNPIANSENLNIGVSDWKNVKKITVLNSLGVKVFESTGILAAGIKTNQFGSGVYVVQLVRIDGQVTTRKFIKL